MNDRSPMRIGISVGDTNGIGLEVVLKALSDRQAYADCSLIIYASMGLLKQNLDLLDIDFSEIDSLPIKLVAGADIIKSNLIYSLIFYDEHLKGLSGWLVIVGIGIF